MTAKTNFRGSFTALVTPFKNGSVDEKAFRDLVDWQIAEGTNGLVPVGTTGESPTLSHDEHKQVVEWCVDQVKGRVPVVAGAGSNSTKEAVELSQHAEKAGADAVLIVTPYYNKPTQEGLYQHYKAINDAIGIPIIIYNIPGRSIVDMSVDTMKRLYRAEEHRRREGRDRQYGRVTQQRAAMGADFNQMSGEDITALGFMAHGGHGCISVTSNVAPRLCAEFQNACLKGDFAAALEAAGQAQPPAHQSVRRDQPGADQVRDVADRQVRQYRAPADGAGDREGAKRRARGHGACRADQLAAGFYRLEHAGLGVLAHLVPGKERAVHRHIDAGGFELRGGRGKAEIEVGVGIAHASGLRRAGENDGLLQLLFGDEGRGQRHGVGAVGDDDRPAWRFGAEVKDFLPVPVGKIEAVLGEQRLHPPGARHDDAVEDVDNGGGFSKGKAAHAGAAPVFLVEGAAGGDDQEGRHRLLRLEALVV